MKILTIFLKTINFFIRFLNIVLRVVFGLVWFINYLFISAKIIKKL